MVVATPLIAQNVSITHQQYTRVNQLVRSFTKALDKREVEENDNPEEDEDEDEEAEVEVEEEEEPYVAPICK